MNFTLTVGAVSKTMRVNILYSCDSRNCRTWKAAASIGKMIKPQKPNIITSKRKEKDEQYTEERTQYMPWRLQ